MDYGSAPAPAPIFSVTVTERAQNAAPRMVLILLAASPDAIRPSTAWRCSSDVKRSNPVVDTPPATGRFLSVHYLERDEVNGLKLLQRQQQANGTKGAYLFINERGQPFVASCAVWSRISVPICAKVEHWCHSPSDPDWCQNSVNVGTAPWLVLSEPQPSADTRENQIGIDFDRFLSPS